MKPTTEVLLFEKPSGNVRGIVTTVSKDGKTTIFQGNATLLTDGPPSVSIKTTSRPTVEMLGHLADAVSEFRAEILKQEPQAQKS